VSRRCHPTKIAYAVGVETSDAGADVWVSGRPFRLHAVVSAGSVADAASEWRDRYGLLPDIFLSPNPAHVDVVRLRQPRVPC
jgi:hypothetical protein